MQPLQVGVGAIVRAASWLVLPLSLLLFLQWPLRDGVQAGSRESNDLAQILFALYVSVAVTAATRARSHLAVDLLAHRYGAVAHARLARAAQVLVAFPAAAFVLYAGAGPTWASIVQLERFPETINPGYFLIRVAVLMMAVLILAQAVLDVVMPPRTAH
ncbi:MAG TPA: TRAP transporter small permease subunit [Usitatibacter sp.]|nr:TRAP transporter small permease subunit [Usitatibacter sp.]